MSDYVEIDMHRERYQDTLAGGGARQTATCPTGWNRSCG
jgi:hypothetical protein